MKNIADAIVFAVSHLSINFVGSEDDVSDMAEAGLGMIAHYLSNCTRDEQDELASAAKRALAIEQADPDGNEEFISDYSTWMEDLYGEGWSGNDRVENVL